MKLSILKEILDEVRDIVWLCDTNWRLIYANKTALRIFGYEEEELKRINLKDIIAKEHLPKALERFNRIVRSKKPIEKDEYLVKTKDGEYIWVEVSTKPIIENGEVVAIFGIGRDVTERKLLEQKLREAEEKFRKIFENSPNIIVLIDEKGVIVEANPAAVRSVGINPVGKNLYDVFPKEVADRRFAFLRKVMEEGKMTVVSERDGRHFLVHGVPVEFGGRKYCLTIAPGNYRSCKTEEHT